MQKYRDSVIDRNGNALQGASVRVYNSGTETLSTIYSDDGVTTAANPLATDSNGAFEFYAAAGDYTLDIRLATAQLAVTDITIGPLEGQLGPFSPAGVGAVDTTIQAKLREVVSVKDFGAVGDGVTDDTAAIQLAVNHLYTLLGGTLFFPDGNYLISSAIGINRAADSTRGRINVRGQSTIGTRITSTHAGSAFNILNSHTGSGEPNTSYQSFENMTLIGPSKLASSAAITADLAAFITFRDLVIQAYDYGIYCQDVDHALFERVHPRFNNKGLFFRKNPSPGAASTQPNNITLLSCTIGNNTDYGIYAIGGANFNVYGGSVENNGTVGAGGFGLKFEDFGYEGGIGANLNGIYFESNNGIADLILQGLAAFPTFNAVTHNVNSCSFHRVSATNVSVNCILAAFGAPATYGRQVLNLNGNTFKSNGAYTPSASRPYISFSITAANKDNFYDVANIYEDADEKPSFIQNLNKRYARVSKSASQTFTTGTYQKWLLDTVLSGGVSWTPTFSSNGVVVDEAGLYLVDVITTWSSAAAGDRSIQVKRGSTVVGHSEATGDVITVQCVVVCSAGDVLTVEVKQSTGGSIDLAGSGSANSQMTITQLFN